MMTKTPSCTDINEPGLLHFELAKQTILESIPVVQDIQKISIEQAKGRCLAETITSPIQVPGNTNSAVDGYAVHGNDLPDKNAVRTLIIQDTILAGKIYTDICQPGHCLRIMTGAAMPQDLDTVYAGALPADREFSPD